MSNTIKKEIISGIYCIECDVNGKQYIGQSKDILRRFQSHRSKLKNNNHPNAKLQNAYNKYGREHFCFHIFERCPEDKLFEREQYWIQYLDTYKNGYNLSEGGENGNNSPCKPIKQYDLDGNYIRSWKSAAEAARYYETDRTNISYAVKHKRITQNSQWCYADEEITEFAIRKGQTPIAQYDLNNNLINVYKTLNDVIDKNQNFQKYNISSSMHGKWRKTAYGYKWKEISKEEYYDLLKNSFGHSQ